MVELDIKTRLSKMSTIELGKTYKSIFGESPGKLKKSQMIEKIIEKQGTNPVDIFTCSSNSTTYKLLKKDDLYRLAEKCGVDVNYTENKSDLIDLILKKVGNSRKSVATTPKKKSEKKSETKKKLAQRMATPKKPKKKTTVVVDKGETSEVIKLLSMKEILFELCNNKKDIFDHIDLKLWSDVSSQNVENLSDGDLLEVLYLLNEGKPLSNLQ